MNINIRGKFNALRQALPGFGKSRGGEPAVDQEKLMAFVGVCQANDKAAASLMAKKKLVPPQVVGQGLMMFLLVHKTTEGLETLVETSGIRKNPGGFVYGLLTKADSREQQNDCVNFLNKQGVPFQSHDLIGPLSAGNAEATQAIMDSKLFNPQDNHSTALLFAATFGNRAAFMELLKRGADPQDAMMNGPKNDPGLAPGYKNLAVWLGDLYQANLDATLQQILSVLPTPAGAPAREPDPAALATSSHYDPSFYEPKSLKADATAPASAPAPAAPPTPAPEPAQQAPAAPKPIDITLYAPKR